MAVPSNIIGKITWQNLVCKEYNNKFACPFVAKAAAAVHF